MFSVSDKMGLARPDTSPSIKSFLIVKVLKTKRDIIVNGLAYISEFVLS